MGLVAISRDYGSGDDGKEMQMMGGNGDNDDNDGSDDDTDVIMVMTLMMSLFLVFMLIQYKTQLFGVLRVCRLDFFCCPYSRPD